MRISALLIGASLLVLPGLSEARCPDGFCGGPGGGWGHHGHGPMARCGKLLIHAHPEMLKTKLGLSESQLKQLLAIRTTYLKKKIAQRAQVQQYKLELRTLMQTDLPDEAKVLAAMRKARGVKGRMKEEKVKTMLQMLRLLSKEQRAKLRHQCMGPGGKMMGGGPPPCAKGGCPGMCGGHGRGGPPWQ